MMYRDLTDLEKKYKVTELYVTTEARAMINKPILQLIAENKVPKDKFIERLEKESQHINKYFKGNKHNNNQQNLSIRQLTLKSKLTLDKAKKAVENNDRTLTLGGLEAMTRHITPSISRIIDDLREQTDKNKYDIISEFSGLTNNNPNVKSAAKEATEIIIEIHKMSPQERKQDIKELGRWTKEALNNGLLNKNHIRGIYDRKGFYICSPSKGI